MWQARRCQDLTRGDLSGGCLWRSQPRLIDHRLGLGSCDKLLIAPPIASSCSCEDVFRVPKAFVCYLHSVLASSTLAGCLLPCTLRRHAGPARQLTPLLPARACAHACGCLCKVSGMLRVLAMLGTAHIGFDVSLLAWGLNPTKRLAKGRRL